VRWQISCQRTLLMWVLLSHADMHSGMSLPSAPILGLALPPEVSIGTGARAFGPDEAVVSRVAVGSTMVADVELGIAADVAPLPVTTPVGVVVPVPVPVIVVIVPGAAVGTPVVVVMPGLAAPPDVEPKPGSGDVAKSCAPGLGRF